MARWLLVILAASFATALAARGAPDAPVTTQADVLRAALADERQAIEFYEAVMATHGKRRPFSMIIEAERRHEEALLTQFTRLGIEPPQREATVPPPDVPTSFAEACDVAAVAEVRNAALYETLLAATTDAQVREVFTRLRDASQERHLPAFRRHGSGWTVAEDGSLTAAQQAQLATAEQARVAMFGTLLGELATAMAEDGPAHAIAVCSERAPTIAAAIGTDHGVTIGRSSLQLRNPGNAGPVWAQLAMDAKQQTPVTLVDRGGRLGRLTPIRLAAACMQCHGTEADLGPGVATAIAQRYPDDEAIGYAEGDLRGWFWVEVPPMAKGDAPRN